MEEKGQMLVDEPSREPSNVRRKPRRHEAATRESWRPPRARGGPTAGEGCWAQGVCGACSLHVSTAQHVLLEHSRWRKNGSHLQSISIP